MSRNYHLRDFNYELPDELIAQYPLQKRDDARLFVVNHDKSFQHTLFRQLPDFFSKNDIIIINNAKVIPARIFFVRETGGAVEAVLTQRISDTRWLILTNRTKRLKPGETLYAVSDKNITITILNKIDDYLEVESSIIFNDDILGRIGNVPLPPYIRREASDDDIHRYQTVYASNGIAAAAPTAGLHFTDELMQVIHAKGIRIVPVTLNVSWGTFQPVRDEILQKHVMHTEEYSLSSESAEIINTARENGRRIIAVGTTSVRVLEATYRNGINVEGEGETNIFIYPPYSFKSVDALVTNFHTPLSTLLMLVTAFGGYDTVMKAYREAVELRYRFFSYGDAMLLFRND